MSDRILAEELLLLLHDPATGRLLGDANRSPAGSQGRCWPISH